MMKRLLLSLSLTLAFVSAGFAHEGHEHKIMGTIATVSANRLEVKATDGKTVTIALDQKTKLLKGSTKAVLADLKVGQRVVVNVGAGKAPLSAIEVRIGAAPAPAQAVTKATKEAGNAR